MKNYTKQLLAETIKELMKKKSIQKIRVSELCKICEIERSTFYFHFKDKYDLVTYVYLQDFNDIDILDPDQAAVGMERMKKHIQFYQNAYKDFPENFFLNYLQDYYYDAYYSVMEKNMYPDPVTDEMKFHLRLFLSGSTVMSMKWFFTSKPIPADKLMTMVYDAMPESLKKVFYKY